MKFNLSKLEGFEWDEGNLKHIKKHGVDYKECEQIFVNRPLYLDEDKGHSETEDRLKALGKTNSQRLLFVVLTIRENRIRIISARDQNKKERRGYKQSL